MNLYSQDLLIIEKLKKNIDKLLFSEKEELINILRTANGLFELLSGNNIEIGKFNIILNNSNLAINNKITGDVIQTIKLESKSLTQARLFILPIEILPGKSKNILSSSLLPLTSNQDFTGRERELLQIAQLLTSLDQQGVVPKVVITGIGGVGKTSLACEFAYRYGALFEGGVYWISATDKQSLKRNIAICGSPENMALFDPQHTLDIEQQVGLVLNAWKEPIPRLLIFDNCEIDNYNDLMNHIPNIGGCYVILTSKHADWPQISMVHLDVFTIVESAKLICKICPELAFDHAKKLAQELDNLPLAVELAGLYIKQTGIDVDIYINDLRTFQFTNHDSLNLEKKYDIYSPTRHIPSVNATFQLSFNKIRENSKNDPMLLDILSYLVCFSPGEPIEREILFNCINKSNLRKKNFFVKKKYKSDIHLINQSLGQIYNYGLISRSSEDPYMHRIIHNFVYERCYKRFISKSVNLCLFDRLYKSNQNNDVSFMKIAKHIEYAIDMSRHRINSIMSEILCAYGYALYNISDYNSARRYLDRAKLIRSIIYTPWHPKSASVYYVLAMVNQMQCQYKIAETFYKKSLRIRSMFFGKKNPKTLAVISDYAYLLFLVGDFSKSEKMMFEALHISKITKNINYNSIPRNLNNIGYLNLKKGFYRKAFWYLHLAIRIRKRLFSDEHPGVVQSLSNLGTLLLESGRISLARQFINESLELRKNVFQDLEDVGIAESLWNKGRLAFAEGNYSDAQLVLEDSLAMYKRLLPSNHRETALALCWLGITYSMLGKHKLAVSLAEEALQIRHAILLESSFEFIESFYFLGVAHLNGGSFVQAHSMLTEALSRYAAAGQPEHPYTAGVYLALGDLERQQGNQAQAMSYYQKGMVVASQRRCRNVFMLAQAHSAIADLYGLQTDKMQQHNHLYQAQSAFAEAGCPNHPGALRIQVILDSQGSEKNRITNNQERTNAFMDEDNKPIDHKDTKNTNAPLPIHIGSASGVNIVTGSTIYGGLNQDTSSSLEGRGKTDIHTPAKSVSLPVDFLIITALQIELDAVKSVLPNSQMINTVGLPTYFRSTLNSTAGVYEIALARLNDAGNVDAALISQALITALRPRHILMVGIAGGVRNKVLIGDVVISTHVFFYEKSKRLHGKERHEIRSYQSDRELFGRASYLDTSWLHLIQLPRPDGEDTLHPKGKDIRPPMLHLAPIAAGEKVIADEKFLRALEQLDRKIAAFEMESYGVASAAAYGEHRPRFLSIRGISDYGDNTKNDMWHPFAAAAAAAVTIAFLRSGPVLPLASKSQV